MKYIVNVNRTELSKLRVIDVITSMLYYLILIRLQVT